MNYLPDSKKSGKDIPNKGDLQSAMIKRIDADTSAPDIAENPEVKKIKAEMMSRINTAPDRSTLLENYAQMRGMLDGAIWVNEAKEWKWAQDFRDSQTKNWEDLSKLTFLELGDKFRKSIAEAQASIGSKNQKNAKNAHERWDNFTGVTNQKAFVAANQGLEVGFKTLA